MKKIVVIGGGTGSFVLLNALKHLPIKLTAVVNMTDSGGSTGKLRDQLGILPPGDLRQCLVALSEETGLWRQLFTYRFENGDLKGHNVGNILLSALEKIAPNYDGVLEAASKLLKTKGRVVPATLKQAQLCAEYENGDIIKGEGNIDEQIVRSSPIIRAFLEPNVEANPKALKAILEADTIIIAPGDIFTSIVPILLIGGIQETLIKTKAKLMYIVNLMTRAGQTQEFGVYKHIKTIEKYALRKPNYIVVNNARIPKGILALYSLEKEYPVIDDLALYDDVYNVLYGDMIEDDTYEKSNGDAVHRSLLRHSKEKLLAILESSLL
jgi:uncharacterized cofD-like protein